MRLTFRLKISRLTTISVCLYACTLLPFSQVSALSLVELAEEECPCEEDGENAEEILVVLASARRRLKNRQHIGVNQPHQNSAQFRKTASHFGYPPAIVGHQLANGLCAPLLV